MSALVSPQKVTDNVKQINAPASSMNMSEHHLLSSLLVSSQNSQGLQSASFWSHDAARDMQILSKVKSATGKVLAEYYAILCLQLKLTP